MYNYPKGIKAFYMRLNDDGKTVAAMDVLVPKVPSCAIVLVPSFQRARVAITTPASSAHYARRGAHGDMGRKPLAVMAWRE